MSGELIIKRILDEAETEKKQIEKEADIRIALIQAEGRAKSEQKYSEMMNSAKKERELIINRILAQARIKAREKKRAAREYMISLCFDQAKEDLRRIRHSEKYAAVLEYLLENGIHELGETRVVLDICPEDGNIIQEIIKKFEGKGYHLVISPVPVISEGGLIIRSGTRSIHVNNTFEARMQRYRKEILYEVAGVLENADIGEGTDDSND